MGIVQSVSIDGLSFTLFYADEKDGIVRIAHSSEDAFNGRFKQANRIVSDSELNNVRAEHEKDLANIEKAKANLVKAQSAVVAGRKEHLGMVKTRIQEEVIGDKKQLELIVTERNQASQKVDTSVLVKYEDLRNRKKGQAS